MGMDNLVIHKDAPRPDLAHRFINFILAGILILLMSKLITLGSGRVEV